MSDKLNIANEMRAFDSKDRNFYKDLTDEERKKFSNYLMIRWGSSVQGSAELQQYYLFFLIYARAARLAIVFTLLALGYGFFFLVAMISP